MITDYDEYPIHQAPFPVAQPGTGDRNFYDRYWFNGFPKDGSLLFEIGFGRYPNRYVQDAHFSVSIDGTQHCFHASGRAPIDPTDTHVGPLSIEIVRPRKVIRVVLTPNDTEIECDLTFHARSITSQEPKNFMQDGVRVIMETQRFTQFGTWKGYFSIKGRRFEVDHDSCLGMRDRSWGVRPVGEYAGGAPSKLSTEPEVYWIWSPVHFDNFGTQFLTREEPDGFAKEMGGAITPFYDDIEQIPKVEKGEQVMARAEHKIHWEQGTRRAKSAEITLIERDGTRHHIELTPLVRFQMMAIGYQHGEWGHGMWRDELDTGYESWVLDELDPEDYYNIHVHQVVRAKMGEQIGIGILETICFGKHAPSGFADLFDGAP